MTRVNLFCFLLVSCGPLWGAVVVVGGLLSEQVLLFVTFFSRPN